MLPVVAAGYVISRALSGIAVVTFPAARGSGLVKTFQDGAQKKAVRITMIVYLILAAVYLYFCSPVGMVVLLIIAGVVFGYYYRMSRKQFGGVTGDLAGYFCRFVSWHYSWGIDCAGNQMKSRESNEKQRKEEEMYRRWKSS